MSTPSPPDRPALRERWERRRREVIGASARLFARQGFQQTSMSDLTEETGLAAGGLYHYIRGKDDLLIGICDDLLDPLLERAGEIVAGGGPADRQLREVMRAWLRHIETHREHMLVFAQERKVIEREPQWRRVRAKRKAFERLLDEILARGEEEGSMSFPDRALALLALLGMVNYTPQWLRPRGRLSADQIADGYCDLLLRGLGSLSTTKPASG